MRWENASLSTDERMCSLTHWKALTIKSMPIISILQSDRTPAMAQHHEDKRFSTMPTIHYYHCSIDPSGKGSAGPTTGSKHG